MEVLLFGQYSELIEGLLGVLTLYMIWEVFK
jgi:hypothetical protein